MASTGGLGDESVTGTANVDITGIGMTGGIGTVEAAQTATILQTGLSLTSSVGTVDVADVVMGPTGIEMTASVGNERGENTYNFSAYRYRNDCVARR